MNKISFAQIGEFVTSLRGLTRLQLIQLALYMLSAGIAAGWQVAGTPDQRAMAGAAAALVAGIGYLHGVANPTTIGSGAKDAQGRTHL